MRIFWPVLVDISRSWITMPYTSFLTAPQDWLCTFKTGFRKCIESRNSANSNFGMIMKLILLLLSYSCESIVIGCLQSYGFGFSFRRKRFCHCFVFHAVFAWSIKHLAESDVECLLSRAAGLVVVRCETFCDNSIRGNWVKYSDYCHEISEEVTRWRETLCNTFLACDPHQLYTIHNALRLFLAQ